MPRRRARPVRRQHYDVDATITPETGFKLSLLQLVGLVVAVFTIAVGYVYLAWGVSEIKDAQVKTAINTATVIADQDKKRETLGKQFIDSNEKIADSIGKLTTLTAVQQERQKSTDEKLEKVLTQIGAALSTPIPRARP